MANQIQIIIFKLNKSTFILVFWCLIFSLFISACTTSKQMVYINDLNADSSLSQEKRIAKIDFEAKIQKNDLLWITVGGPNSNDLIALNSASGVPTQGGAALMSQGNQVAGYLVESDGTIKMPYIGRIKVEGMTRLEIEDSLKRSFSDFTLNPVVNVRFLNYRVTVLGEVNRPGPISIPNERITILEAIGMAGDLTIMGRRETVRIVREVNGQREVGKINLLSSDIFKSDYYYLKTNDVVYVEPAPAKFFARERLPQFISLAAGSLSLLAIILSIR